MNFPGGVPSIPVPRDIESLRGRTDPAAVKAAAREMESLFAYEMVKAMRATAEGSATGDGFGGEVYGSLFDMELAKVLASRGLGLQQLLLKGLDRAETSQKNLENKKVADSAGIPSDIAAQPAEQSAAQPAAAVPPAVASSPAPSAAAVPRVSGPHTHEPLEEIEPVVSTSEEGEFPIRDGGRISSAYGYRKDPLTGASKFHHGVDIAAAEGTPVYPAKGGEVTFSGYQKGYGNVVVVDHGNGFVTRYAHNRANRVATGDRVAKDTVIAEVGSTGRSTGPHLHFEVRYEGKKVHPETVFAGAAKGNV